MNIITYSVAGTGGTIYRGIPSREVALIMAVDLVRYEVDEWSLSEDTLERADVTIEQPEPYPGCPPWDLVTSKWEWRGLGVHEEQRCECCRRTL